jgi:hypothetical protein
MKIAKAIIMSISLVFIVARKATPLLNAGLGDS